MYRYAKQTESAGEMYMNKKTIEKEMYIELGKRLSDLRKLNNLTQEEVEKRLGVKQETISMIELANRKPSVFLLKQLAELYDTTLDKLLDIQPSNSSSSDITPESKLQSINLLLSLCESSRSEELTQFVTAYLNMCVYSVMREIYEANPRNTDKIFSLEKDFALKKLADHIEKAPAQLSSFIKASNGKVKKNAIEPPLEKASEFREFIAQTESYIKNFLME